MVVTPMATTTARKNRTNGLLTTVQYMALPDDGNRYELIHGELVMSPSGLYKHGAVILYVGARLQEFVLTRSLGLVGVETDVIMGKDLVLRPDINFISKRNASIIRGHIHGPPDLVVEVTSPGNWQMDVFAKRHDYERFGIREYWVIDISQKQYKAYQWNLQGDRYRGGLISEAVIKSRVVKGFKLKLEDIWKAAAV